MDVTIHWNELLSGIAKLIMFISWSCIMYWVGYAKRSKELETDFDFEKQDKKQ